MSRYIFEKIKGLFQKSNKQNSIQIGTMKNGDIYQNSTIRIEDPAIAIAHMKNNSEDLKIILGSISNVLIKENETLPPGYQMAVTMKGGKADIYSEPINEEARQKYPQRIKARAKIDIPKGMSFQEALNRARISQIPINVEMIDMQKMIGDIIDPYQDWFQRAWRKSTFKIVPEELPAGMRCVIGIEGIPYQYNTVMRIQPVDPDANIVKISNEEYSKDFVLALTYHMDTENMDFTYRFSGQSWKCIYKFLNFMKAAIPENVLYIRLIEQNQDLFSIKLDQTLYGDEYDNIDDSIDIARRLLMIENQYGVQFSTNQDLLDEDIELIYFLSDSIMKNPSGFRWNNINLVGNLHMENIERLNADACLEFRETVSITILGQKIANLVVSVKFESVRVANLDEVKKLIKTHKTEQIQISLVPGSRGNHGVRIVEI